MRWPSGHACYAQICNPCNSWAYFQFRMSLADIGDFILEIGILRTCSIRQVRITVKYLTCAKRHPVRISGEKRLSWVIISCFLPVPPAKYRDNTFRWATTAYFIIHMVQAWVATKVRTCIYRTHSCPCYQPFLLRFSWSSSVSPGGCQDSILKQITVSSLHILT
jgi:hypothetical protein